MKHTKAASNAAREAGWLQRRLLAPLALITLLGAGPAMAQSLTPPTPQFAFTGFIQEATLDTTGAICTPAPQTDATGAAIDVSRLRGGTMTVNGVKMIVPCNSIVQMSAATFTWADLFDPANSTPVGTYIGALTGAVPANPTLPGVKTGLALADSPMPFPSFAVSATGNVVGKYAADIDVNGDGVPDLLAGTDKYVVAYITPIEQQVLNGSSGIVSCIDYTNGSLRVGGVLSTAPGGACPATGATGSLLQFNDPPLTDAAGNPVVDPTTGKLQGRWGLAHSIDPRWSGDNENTTIHASTGIPVCIPRVAPPNVDPLCPLKNRPANGSSFGSDPFLAAGAPLKNFMMPTPAQADLTPTLPDPRQQVPIMVGDQVNWIGNVYQIDPAKKLADGVTPDTTPANTYMSVHTLEDVLGIFTQPGVPPAYVSIEDFLIGSGGAAVQGILQEASTRLTVVGFTTDPTQLVDIYAQDVNPCTGQETLRLLATTDPTTQPLVGRFVHRVLGGDFMPPTRYYVVKSRTQQLDANGDPVLVANGIANGQYLLPIFEYVIPENHKLGDPIIPGNFQDFPFLAQGSGPVDGFGSATAVVGQLDPWPGDVAPTKVNCAAAGATPIVNAGADITVGSGTLVTLRGTVNWDATNSDPATRVVTWTQLSGDPVTLGTTIVSPSNPSTVSTTFTAPASAQTLTFQLTATDNVTAATGAPITDAVNVTVVPTTDSVQVTLGTWVLQKGKRGPFGKLNVTATTTDPTAILSLSQISTDGSFIDWGTGTNSPNNLTTFDWVEIKGALQPVSLTVRSSKGGSATVTCTPDGRGGVTCP